MYKVLRKFFDFCQINYVDLFNSTLTSDFYPAIRETFKFEYTVKMFPVIFIGLIYNFYDRFNIESRRSYFILIFTINFFPGFKVPTM